MQLGWRPAEGNGELSVFNLRMVGVLLLSRRTYSFVSFLFMLVCILLRSVSGEPYVLN